MPKMRIAIAVDRALLDQLDELIAHQQFRSRSQAIGAALAEKLERSRRSRLALECENLDPEEEKQFAEEGLAGALNRWPAYELGATSQRRRAR